MSTGRDPKTMPVTKEYEEGYERTFGNKGPTRGKWVVDRRTGKVVPIEEYQPPEEELAVNANVMAGRFYENVKAVDGTDIGSRAKRKEYMRLKNYADVSDYTNEWEAARKKREAVYLGQHDIRERREQIGRAMYEHKEKLRRR